MQAQAVRWGFLGGHSFTESFECVVIRTALRSAKEWIHCIAIDEAHYIEQWYLMIIIFYCKCLFFYYFCRFVQTDSI